MLAKLDSDDRDADTAAFVVPLDLGGVTVGKDEPMLGFRGMPMASLHFDDCHVPTAWRLAVNGFAGMLEGLNLARLDAGAYGLGFLRAALRESAGYVRERVAFGKPLANLQLVQDKLGVCTPTTWLLAACCARGSGRSLPAAAVTTPDPGRQDGRQRRPMRHTVEAVQLHGGFGVHLHYPVQRLMRDAKITQMIDGTSEIHSLMLGRAATRADWLDPTVDV